MNARVLFILLVISVLLAFTQRYRKLGVGLSVVLMLLLVWFNIHVTPLTPTLPAIPSLIASSSSTASMVKPTAQLQTMQLSGNGAPWRLIGRIQNTSAAPLHALSLNIERFDCPTAAAIQTDCVLLWQGMHVLRIELAAAADTKVSESFYSHEAVPRLSGVARDRFTITDVQ